MKAQIVIHIEVFGQKYQSQSGPYHQNLNLLKFEKNGMTIYVNNLQPTIIYFLQHTEPV